MDRREHRERAVVRELAQRIAEIAHAPDNRAIQQRWRDVNELRRPDRAPVWCRPVGCWPELLPEESLSCADPWLRGLERRFRQTLVKREIGDDTPVEDWYGVSAAFDCEPANAWGLGMGRHSADMAGGAWAYNPPLRLAEDFDALRLPRLTLNRARTDERLERTTELLEGILPVRLTCGAPLSATLCTAAAGLRGLTELMMDMAVAPELVHRLMAHLRDGVIGAMADVAATGLLTSNNHGPMTACDAIGEEREGGKVGYANMWCSANSQELDQVSRAMWEEFLLAYQLPIMAQFGRVAYGCCENLTRKIDGVLSIPNLRIFVCSAWTDLGKVVDAVGQNTVIMWRQKASDVVYGDEASIRRHLEEGLRRTQGCYVQIVLRELQTLAGNRDRLRVWANLAKEAAATFA